MRTTLVPLLLLLAACGGDDGGGGGGSLGDIDPADITGAADMEIWASASAPNVFVSAYLPLTMADLAREEGDCPALVEEGDTVTYEGGCTDADGRTWIGTATTVGDETTPSASIVYDGFGFQTEEECEGASVPSELAWSGGIDLTMDGDEVSLAIDVGAETSNPGSDCEPFEGSIGIDYDLTMSDGGDMNLWNGSGQVGNSLYGKVDATTEDEVVDGAACDSEALSGTTTVTASGDVAVITYDGETDCDEESTVTWTLNGEEQGELTGVSCAAGGAGGGGLAAAALLLVAGALARRRRQAT